MIRIHVVEFAQKVPGPNSKQTWTLKSRIHLVVDQYLARMTSFDNLFDNIQTTMFYFPLKISKLEHNCTESGLSVLDIVQQTVRGHRSKEPNCDLLLSGETSPPRGVIQ